MSTIQIDNSPPSGASALTLNEVGCLLSVICERASSAAATRSFRVEQKKLLIDALKSNTGYAIQALGGRSHSWRLHVDDLVPHCIQH